jgi:hypothetical protein
MAITDKASSRHPLEPAKQAALDESQLAAALAEAYRRRPKVKPVANLPAPDPDPATPETLRTISVAPPLPATTSTGVESEASDEDVDRIREVAAAGELEYADEQTERPDRLQWLQRARQRRLLSRLHRAAAWTMAIAVGCLIAAIVALLLFGLPDQIAARLPGIAKVPSLSAVTSGTTAR